ncbi:hypothetical protein NYG95_08230 [Campylobacter felis]|uniref:Chromosome partition protein Smc n=1 Tax=Campylobacter felis TaxID=2974565 RepID=A0ABT7I5L2_9BACT|nr:hypothetical protein [Campylobacter felis]
MRELNETLNDEESGALNVETQSQTSDVARGNGVRVETEAEQGGEVKPETSEEQLLKKLENALNQNVNWLEQIKLTLMSVYSLFKTNESLKKGYDFVLSEANKTLEDTRSVYNDTLALKESTAELNEEVKELDANASGLLQNVERLKDEIIEVENNIANDKDDTRALIQRGEALKSEFEEINTRLEGANSLITEFVTLYGEKKAEITHTLEGARTELEGYVNTTRTEINAAKGELDRTDLESQKNEILEEINRVKEEARAQLNSTDLNSQKEQITSEINAVKQQILTEINRVKEEARAELNGADLESQKNEILEEINRVKEEARAELNETDQYLIRMFTYILNHLNLPFPPNDREILPEGDLLPNEEDE